MFFPHSTLVFISRYDYLGVINKPIDLTYRLVAIDGEAADSQHNPLVKGGSITYGLPFRILQRFMITRLPEL